MSSQSVAREKCKSTQETSVKYAYVMYKQPCGNPGAKHPGKEVVPVNLIKKFRADNAVGREYQIICGQGICVATIGLVGESLLDVQQKIEATRVKFVSSQLSRPPSDLSSSYDSELQQKNSRHKGDRHVMEKKQNLVANKLRVMKIETVPRDQHWKKVSSVGYTVAEQDAARTKQTSCAMKESEMENSSADTDSEVHIKGVSKVRPKELRTYETRKHTSESDSESLCTKGSNGTLLVPEFEQETKKLSTGGDRRERKIAYTERRKTDDYKSAETDSEVHVKHVSKTRKIQSQPLETMDNGSESDSSGLVSMAKSDSTMTINKHQDKKKLSTGSRAAAHNVAGTKQKAGATKKSETKNSSTTTTTDSEVYVKRVSKTRRTQSPPIKTKNNESESDSSGLVSMAESDETMIIINERQDKKKLSRGYTVAKQDAAPTEQMTRATKKSETKNSSTTTTTDSEVHVKDVSKVRRTELRTYETKKHTSESDTHSPSTSKADGGIGTNQETNHVIEELLDVLKRGSDLEGSLNSDNDDDVTRLKRRLLDTEKENRALRVLNVQLQMKLLCNCEKVEATLANVDETVQVTIRERIAHGKDMPVGFIDTPNNKIHAGYGIWIDKTGYDRLRLKRKITPSMFIANVARLIFTDKVMRSSSVTGTISNAFKRQGRSKMIAKPALSVTGLEAVRAISKFWMSEKKMAEKDIANHLSLMTAYIAKKISDMTRPPRLDRKQPKTSHKGKRIASREVIEASEEENDTETSLQTGHDDDDDILPSGSVGKRKRIFGKEKKNETQSEKEDHGAESDEGPEPQTQTEKKRNKQSYDPVTVRSCERDEEYTKEMSRKETESDCRKTHNVKDIEGTQRQIRRDQSPTSPVIRARGAEDAAITRHSDNGDEKQDGSEHPHPVEKSIEDLDDWIFKGKNV